MRISKGVLSAILSTFPPVPPECGGILGSIDEKQLITHFAFDAGLPSYNRAVYTPNIPFLNSLLSDYANMNIQFCGIVHSHPAGQTTLSTADKQYIQAVLDALPFVAEKLYFPIVIPFSQLIPYSISKNTGLIQLEDLEIV